LGGGRELLAAMIVAFIWASRPKFFYYMAVLALNLGLQGYLKIFYADPRPYMVSGDIKPISCSREFGNPSGHSLAASFFAVAVFLDVFHGTSISETP
jgi:membrane-associated phospholipid phosphatase